MANKKGRGKTVKGLGYVSSWRQEDKWKVLNQSTAVLRSTF